MQMQILHNEHKELGTLLRMRLWRLLLDSADATDSEVLISSAATPERLIESAATMLEEDLAHFARVDPASHGDAQLILQTYSSFACTVCYRLAHAILTVDGDSVHRKRAARWLADKGKVISGVDIHPSATIGRRLVLDHAIGTVVGETSEIGDDCYILGGVILGALGISRNPAGKRHPKLGNGVQVGSYARVLGPITVGDNAFIAAHCVVTDNVPINGRVSIVNQVQLHYGGLSEEPNSRVRVSGVGIVSRDLVIMGTGFRHPKVDILDEDFRVLPAIKTRVLCIDSNTVRISILRATVRRDKVPGSLHLRIRDVGDQITVLAPTGLTQMVAEDCDLKAICA